jgi:hypothetical protein
MEPRDNKNRKYIFFPYFRKGLNAYLTEIDGDTSTSNKIHGSVPLAITLDCKKDDVETSKAETVKFDLVGPGEVKGINSNAILQVFPADGSIWLSNKYMPFVEFYEEDFPWRYTPFNGNEGKLRSWMTLIVCKDDEFEVKDGQEGMKYVELKDPSTILPTTDSLWKLSHVQICDDSDDLVDLINNVNQVGTESLQTKINEILTSTPDAGISRLMNNRHLYENTHYTAFIIPTFELGRLAGLGKEFEGANIQSGAWDNKETKDFPIYYKWSFSTGEGSFKDLAEKLNPVSVEIQQKLSSYITAETKDCGLNASSGKSTVIDVPVACRKIGDDSDNNLRTEGVDYQKEVADLLRLSPTLVEDQNLKDGQGAQTLDDGDPWVVPPVYGAKHVVAVKSDKALTDIGWVNEMNTILRNRIAGGLGKKIVQENQEQFVHRAWLQVEQINALNKRLREMLLMVYTNKASGKKHIDDNVEKKRDRIKNNANISSMSSDAFVRVLQISNGSDQTSSEMVAELGDNMTPVEKYCMDNYTYSRGVNDDFLIDMFKTENTFVRNKIEDLAILSDPVLYSALNTNHYFSRRMPNTVAFDSLFNIIYNRLDKYKDQKDNWVVAKPNGSDPFVFIPFRSFFNSIPHCSKIGNSLINELLAWLTGFDDSPKEKDAYDELWTLENTLYYIKQIKRGWPLLYDSVDSKKNDSFLVHQRFIMVRDRESNSHPGYIVSDDFFNNNIQKLDKDKQAKIIRIQYRDADAQNDASPCYLYIIPWSSLFNGGENVKAKLLLNAETGDSQDLEFDLKNRRFIFKAFPNNLPCVGGTLLDKTVSDNVNPDFNSRLYNRDRGKFELGLSNCNREFAYMSRFDSLNDYIAIFKRLKDSNIFEISFKYSYNDACFLYKNDDLKIRLSLEGYMRLTIRNKSKVQPKPYSHCISFDAKECFFHKNNKAVIGITICEQDGNGGLLGYLEQVRQELKDLIPILCDPDFIEINSEVQEFNAWTFVNGDDAIEKFNTEVETNIINNFSSVAKSITDELNNKSQVTPEEKPKETVTDEPTDKNRASDAAMNKLTSILTKFYGNDSSVDINQLLRSKYPLMAYPQYPDPTYFYLRELSSRFILPSANELPANSISLFRNNPVFEEAFLCGMNTEMGKELLWREYPTDERGSYFRKFWDSEDDPCEETYHDVKMLHEWESALGQNHQGNKGSLLVFAIKGELMQNYPQTIIYLLSQEQVKTLPVMSAWLTNDIYIVGFSMEEKDIDGKYLVFQERDTALHFDNKDESESANSAQYAQNRVHKPYIWRCLISNKIN